MDAALSKDSEQQKLAQEELIPLCTSWTNPEWEELDWTKIKDLSFRNILDERRRAAEAAQNKVCIQCPKFTQHVGSLTSHARWDIELTLAVCHATRRVVD